MSKLVALFTGGKESVYSILMAERLGHQVEKLLFLERPGFSAHKANLSAVRAVAEMLGHGLTVIRTSSNFEDDERLIAYLRKSRKEGVDGLLTGNVKLEERSRIHEELSEKAGLKLIEPLRGLDTVELMMEYSKIDLQFTIIGIRDERLDAKWLGTIISKQNIEEFLMDVLSSGIDPCGEYGEYHSLVVSLDLLGIKLEYDLITLIEEENKIKYITIQDPRMTKFKK
ncbi:MAG: hypothetical protein NDP13_06355 [Crenarchaeota archaeon]|nr:hypothetical protein [Thermoproteota archaeon]